MRRAQGGFTLIELMIVVLIVGVLAAIAVPAYQNYTVRSKISEALAIMGACKTAVTDYLASNGALPPDIAASGCQGYGSTQYVGGVDVVDGVIMITMATLTELGSASGKSVTLTPTLNAGNYITAWTCEPEDMPSNLLPGGCRS